MIRKIFIGLVIGFVSLTLKAQDELSFGIGYDWSDLDKIEQQSIELTAEKYLTMLHEKDLENFWNECHLQFKTSTPKISFLQIGALISEAIPSYDSLTLINVKVTKFNSPPNQAQLSVGGTLDRNDPNFIQFYTSEGVKEQVLLIYRTNTYPIDRSLAIKLGLDGDKYKLLRFDINSRAFNNKDSKYYEELAQKWKSKDSKIPYFFAQYLAQRFNVLGQGIASHDFLRTSEEIKIIQSDTSFINNVRNWRVNDIDYNIINLDFTETQEDITPTIIYLSKQELGEKKTTKEASLLFDWFKSKYPDLVDEFKVFIFQAYDEYPALQTKQYKYYRVIKRLDKKE